MKVFEKARKEIRTRNGEREAEDRELGWGSGDLEKQG